MKSAKQTPDDFIVPLNINGLEGRMLRLPAKHKSKAKREILFLYGSHSSIERWWGLSTELTKFGTVTVPDLPGLGGMTSLYKIGRSATIDHMADYMAAFIKLKYKNKKVTLMGMSLGFVIITRMLQKYPELSKKVNMLVSIVGFAHNEDLIFSKKRLFIYRNTSRIFAHKLPATMFRYTVLQPVFIRYAYHRTHNAKEKFEAMSGDEFKRTMEMEIELWHINDVRTQFKNYLEIFALDNTNVPVALPVYHVAAKKDRFFNVTRVEEHMRRIFTDFHLYYTSAPNHAPTVIATAKEASNFVPKDLAKIINRIK